LRGVVWTPAHNQRAIRDGRLRGWDMVRHRLKGEDDRPMIYFFDTCPHTIRTLPAMQHDATKFEDIDTESEDHCAWCATPVCLAPTSHAVHRCKNRSWERMQSVRMSCQ